MQDISIEESLNKEKDRYLDEVILRSFGAKKTYSKEDRLKALQKLKKSIARKNGALLCK